MKTRDVTIDADHILFFVAESQQYKTELGGRSLGKIDMTPYKEHFMRVIEDYVTTAEVESIAYGWTIGKTRVILSDHKNFRHDIYPKYKEGRPEKKGVLKKLKKWAMKKYQCEPNTEADEVCCYYVRKGGIGFSTDKDVLNTEGKWFNTHWKHRTWSDNTKEHAYRFMLMQILAGDSTDNIDGIVGVGLKTAEKLLNIHGWDWNGVKLAYQSKGLQEADALLTRNLVDMTIWSPKEGIKLWELEKK